MRIFRREWYTVHAVFCVHFTVTIARADNLHPDNWETGEKGIETRQAFTEIVDDEPSVEMSFQKKLIPIKEPRKNLRIFALPLEPDAEMLPLHYTSVKPPGVDHMELKYAESQVSQVVPKVEKADDNRQVAKKSKKEGNEGGYREVSSFEKGRKGDSSKKKKRTEYVEIGGKRKVQHNRGRNSGQKIKRTKGKKGGNYRVGNNDHVNRKTIGYLNVYHKDEYKRDHDFYGNDDQGGHSKKHGRYNEKHVAIEGRYRKGGAHDSDDVNEAKHQKQGNSQASGETRDHEIHHG